VEIKDYNKTPQVIDLIQEMKAEESVIIFCFDFDAISTAKQMNSKIPVCYLRGLIEEEHIQKLKAIDGEFVGSGSQGTASIIEFAHTQGVKYWRWTVNSVDEMKTLISRGIDGIITNYPQEMVKLVN